MFQGRFNFFRVFFFFSFIVVTFASTSCVKPPLNRGKLVVNQKKDALERQKNGVSSTLESFGVPDEVTAAINSDLQELDSLEPGPLVVQRILEITIRELVESGVDQKTIAQIVSEVAGQNVEYLQGVAKADGSEITSVKVWVDILDALLSASEKTVDLGLMSTLVAYRETVMVLTKAASAEEKVELKEQIFAMLARHLGDDLPPQSVALLSEEILSDREDFESVLLRIDPALTARLSSSAITEVTAGTPTTRIRVTWSPPAGDDWSGITGAKIYHAAGEGELVFLGECLCSTAGCPEKITSCEVDGLNEVSSYDVFLALTHEWGVETPYSAVSSATHRYSRNTSSADSTAGQSEPSSGETTTVGGSSGEASGGSTPSETSPPDSVQLDLTPGTVSSFSLVGGVSPGAPVVFTVSNSGNLSSAPLMIPSLSGTSAGQFELLADGCTGNSLAPEGNCTFQLRPSADQNGSFGATLVVSDGTNTSNSASLSGLAAGFDPQLSLSPSSATDMNVPTGSSPGASVTFTLTNSGAGASEAVSNAILTGDASDFEIINNNCLGVVLNPSQSCTFQVRPNPVSNGNYTGTISVAAGALSSNMAALSGAASGFPDSFQSVWQTDIPGSTEANQISLPLVSGGSYDFYVEWGDGTRNQISSWLDGAKTHTYSSAGTYTVKITGLFQGIQFDGPTDAAKILSITHWGSLQFGSAGGAFSGCSNLQVTATDTPNLSGVSNLSAAFKDASSFNADLSGWNVSAVSNFSEMFDGATNFNGDVRGWNVSSGQNFSGMFSGASQFNQDLSAWNVSAGTNFSSMFSGASQFNQDISGWNVAAGTSFAAMFSGAASFNQPIGGWNVANGRDFSLMFSGASAFNQPLGSWNMSQAENLSFMFTLMSFNQNLSGWNTGNVTNFSSMFRLNPSFNQPIFADVAAGTSFRAMFEGATQFNQNISAWNTGQARVFDFMFSGATSFNQNIGGWNTSLGETFMSMFNGATAFDQDLGGWNVEAATNFSSFLRGTNLSQANYDALLIGWEAQNLRQLVIFGRGNTTHSAAAQAAYDSLTDLFGAHRWIISAI